MNTKTTKKLSKEELYEVEITDLAAGGKGLARIDGKVVFVEKGIPGQIAGVRVFKDRKDYAEARMVNIVKNSPEFVEPRCGHFAICGGCNIQNIRYEEQLRYKRKWVIESLTGIGKLTGVDVRETIPSPEVFYYRNKMEYSFASKLWDPVKSGICKDRVGLGLHLPGRYDTVFDVEECHLLSEQSSAIVRYTREFARASGLPAFDFQRHKGFWRLLIIREGKKTGEMMLNILTGSAGEAEKAIVGTLAEKLLQEFGSITVLAHSENSSRSHAALWDNIRVLHGSNYIQENIGSFVFRIDCSTFFQTNSYQAENLYEIVKSAGDFNGDEIVYDLFSGAGTISIYLSDAVKSVVGFEIVESSVIAAGKNAKRNNIENCQFVAGKVRTLIKYTPSLFKQYGRPDVVITDPPRSGMDPKTVERVINLHAPKIIYVSCNPSTLARDLAALSRFYEIKWIAPVDMFPHTAHVETVTLLEWKSGDSR